MEFASSIQAFGGYFFVALNIFLLVYLSWGSIYQFFYAFLGLFYNNNKNRKAFSGLKPRRIAVFIPSYKEDAVILQSAREAIKQNYPTDSFDVIVIADKLQAETVNILKAMPLQVIEVAFETSTKSKSLNAALNILRGGLKKYDIAVILDADNVMATDFLNRINADFANGAQAVQGRRAPKNLDAPMAVLDAASEDVNNHILCRGHRVFGLSARLAGSGMAFDFRLFDRVMPSVDAIGGFDKELELRLTSIGIKLEYDEEAIVFDEKVSKSQSFSRQRSRWLAAQYKYARRYVGRGVVGMLTSGNFDFLNKSLQMTLPPRLILPAALFFGTVLNIIFGSNMMLFWALAFAMNIASFLIAMPKYCFEWRNLRAFLAIPRALFATLLALTKLREASRRFIHTPHQVVDIQNVA